jgi:hypothetical protein
MMRILRLSVVGVLLTVAACATPSNGSNTGSTGEASSPIIPKPTGTPPALRPNEATPDSRALDLKPTRWNRTEAAGRQLTVHFTATGRPDCSVLGRVDVQETAQTVTVTVHLGRLPGSNCAGPQPLIAAPSATVITLREPVGGRSIRDGAPS